MAVGRVHLLYGLAGSGKTTLARELAADGAAVWFTLDEWMLRLHPGLPFDDVGYPARAEVVRELIWTIAGQVLQSGIDVVLDWNSWSRERRAWVVSRAAEISASVVLHRLSVSIDEATARAAERVDEHAHAIDRAGNGHLSSIMEPPTEDEGLSIVDA